MFITGWQRESRVKDRSPLADEFSRHCVFNGGTQRSTLPRYQSEELKILNISFPRMVMQPTTVDIYILEPLRHNNNFINKKYLVLLPLNNKVETKFLHFAGLRCRIVRNT